MYLPVNVGGVNLWNLQQLVMGSHTKYFLFPQQIFELSVFSFAFSNTSYYQCANSRNRTTEISEIDVWVFSTFTFLSCCLQSSWQIWIATWDLRLPNARSQDFVRVLDRRTLLIAVLRKPVMIAHLSSSDDSKFWSTSFRLEFTSKYWTV